MTDEEKNAVAVALTRELLRRSNHREPTQGEIDEERTKRKAYYASLSLAELAEIRHSLRLRLGR
jgi:hypothetical protein